MSAEKSFKNASLDLVQLNNVIVSLRSTTKKAKLFIFRKLKRRNDLLMKKKDRTTAERKQKSVAMEIDLLKKWNVDKITKAALANDSNLTKGLQDHNCEVRLLSKLCNVPCLRSKITDFRANHSDWKDLTSFLLYKNTGGKFKTKKESHGPVAFVDEDDSDLLSIGSLSEDDISFDEGDAVDSFNKHQIIDNSDNKAELDNSSQVSFDALEDAVRTSKIADNSKILNKNSSIKADSNAKLIDGKRTQKYSRSAKADKTNVTPYSSGQKKSNVLYEPINVTDVLTCNNSLDTIKARLMGDAMFVETDDGSSRIKEKKQERPLTDVDPVIQRKFDRTSDTRRPAHKKRRDGNTSTSVGRNVYRNEVQITKGNSEEDIHPSWSAKLKEKEKMLALKTNKATKIVFDDSD